MIFKFSKNRKFSGFDPANTMQRPENHKSVSRLEGARVHTWLQFISCEALSFNSPSGGPFGHFLGVLLWHVFFDFNPKFSPSKWAPETKASLWQGFQTMRNPMVITIFFHLHGIYWHTTNFGVIFGPFWPENTKNAFRKNPNDSKWVQSDPKSFFKHWGITFFEF